MDSHNERSDDTRSPLNDPFRDWIEIEEAFVALGIAIGILRPGHIPGWEIKGASPISSAMYDTIKILVSHGLLETNFQIEPDGGWSEPESPRTKTGDYAFRRARSNIYAGFDLAAFGAPLPQQGLE